MDWHIDHGHSWTGRPIYTKANVYVMLRLTVGSTSFTIDMAPYLRTSTVRRLNQAREKGQQLTFRTKIHIAREMLQAVAI